jgi:hypothetical protein
MQPSVELDENLDEGIVADKVLVEELQTEAEHGEDTLDEDDGFLGSAATEVWEYEVVDARAKEFEQAIQNSDLVLEYDVVDADSTTADEATDPLPDTGGVYARDGVPAKASGDMHKASADDPRLGLTNEGQTPAGDWAADTGPSRNPEPEVQGKGRGDRSTLSPSR